MKPLDEQRVFLGMPGYGCVTPGASRAFWRASKYPNRMWYQYNEGSLLAQNFNIIWSIALNLMLDGKPPAFFAMLHADLAAEDFWLDALIEELVEWDLDVLGVVSPIKDERGLTSIAVAREDGNNWRARCRLSMKEIYRLPETFTSRDVGGPLLLNSGCWVCRFDPAWVKKVHFTINDRIVFNAARNQYAAEVESEDWFASRLFHELGLKVGCTRKIKLAHRGSHNYLNTHPWGGQEYDNDLIEESLIPDAPDDPFNFPDEIEGWLSYTEGEALNKLAAGKRVLEIGSYQGRSTVCMAQSAKRVWSVDPHDSRGTGKRGYTEATFRSNLVQAEVAHKVEVLVGTFAYVRPMLDHHKFDLIFIDGAHDRDAVESDIEYALDLVAPGGLLVFHDYRNHPGQFDDRWDPGVTAAVEELLNHGAALVSRHESLAVVRPPAAIPLEV